MDSSSFDSSKSGLPSKWDRAYYFTKDGALYTQLPQKVLVCLVCVCVCVHVCMCACVCVKIIGGYLLVYLLVNFNSVSLGNHVMQLAHIRIAFFIVVLYPGGWAY